MFLDILRKLETGGLVLYLDQLLAVALFDSLEEVEVDFAARGVDFGLCVPVLWSAWLSLVEL